jgi:hypothetical protein
MLFLDLHSLEMDMVEQIRERLRSGELVPTFSDLLYVSIALEKAWQQSVRAIDRSEEVKPERPMIPQQNYEETISEAINSCLTYPLHGGRQVSSLGRT